MRTTEPTLDDLLAEPIVRLLMQRDGVDEAELRALVDRVRRRVDLQWLAPSRRRSSTGLSTNGFEACLA